MGYANTVSDPATGAFSFDNLKSSDLREVDGKMVRVIYGYKVRVSDETFRSRNLLAANWRVDEAQPNYTIDSDLDYKTGYLMAADEYAVLLNVADDEDYQANDNLNPDGATWLRYVSQESNLLAAGNSHNEAQNEADNYGRRPTPVAVNADAITAATPGHTASATDVVLVGAAGAVVDTLTKAATLAGTYLGADYAATLAQGLKGTPAATLNYDLAKGAGRAHNDGGFMEIPTQSISGYVWADADYDGMATANDKNPALVDYDDANVLFSIDGTGYAEHGLVGKTVTLKQWYFVPADGNGTQEADGNYSGGNGGQWILNTVTETTLEGEGDDAHEVTTTRDAVFTTQTVAGDGANHSDGYYEFTNLPIYVAVDGVERLCGYTVEVKGGTEADAVNFPVTKIEAEDALYASTAHTVGTTLLGQKANGATGQLDVTYNKFSGSSLTAQRVYDEGNYPLMWNNLTGQAKKTEGSDELVGDEASSVTVNTSNSTLDGMIILAGNVTTYTQDDNYKMVQRRAMTDAEGNVVYGTVAFDMATGRSDNRVSAGYGYFGTSIIQGVVWRDGDFDGLLKGLGSGTASDQLMTNTTVELTQWYYLEGSLDMAGNFVSNEVRANDGTLLRHSGSFATKALNADGVMADDVNNIELVYEGTTVVGAWIRNANFGDKLYAADDPDTAEDESTQFVGYAGKKVTTTVNPARFDADPDSTVPGAQSWNYQFTELMPYVAFEADADGVLGAPLAASNEELYGIASAADDFLAPAAYRVAVPNLPDKHVLTAYHVADTANTTENDSDAKRDLARLDAKGDGTVTSYPQFTAANPAVQPDGSYAETTGFILLANSTTAGDTSYGSAAANAQDATPYNASFAGVSYDVANQVPVRRQVNTGIYKVPTSVVTGVVWDDTEATENTAADGKRTDKEEGLANQQVIITQWYYADKDATLADGTTVKAGQWYQSKAFGSEWLTTHEVPAVVVNPGDPASVRVR